MWGCGGVGCWAVVFTLTPRGSRAMDMFISTCLYTRKKVHTPILSIIVYNPKLFVFAEIAGSLQDFCTGLLQIDVIYHPIVVTLQHTYVLIETNYNTSM